MLKQCEEEIHYLSNQVNHVCLDLQLHMQAIVAVLLATFSGFGVTMALSSILEKILRRTRPWLDQSTHQTTDGSLTTDHASNASRSSTWSSTATQGPTAVWNSTRYLAPEPNRSSWSRYPNGNFRSLAPAVDMEFKSCIYALPTFVYFIPLMLYSWFM